MLTYYYKVRTLNTIKTESAYKLAPASAAKRQDSILLLRKVLNNKCELLAVKRVVWESRKSKDDRAKTPCPAGLPTHTSCAATHGVTLTLQSAILLLLSGQSLAAKVVRAPTVAGKELPQDMQAKSTGTLDRLLNFRHTSHPLHFATSHLQARCVSVMALVNQKVFLLSKNAARCVCPSTARQPSLDISPAFWGS